MCSIPSSTHDQNAYDAFLAGKRREAVPLGFAVTENDLHPALFDWQRAIVRWALYRGRAAIWADCGLGKTLEQLEWARHVVMHTAMPVLILAPLAVAQQTRREGEKFGIPVTICRAQTDVRPGINITNYEMLHHFNPATFSGVVADESGVLKNYSGKTKQALVEAFASTPYRLCCTATPAPNDVLELGNHAEFLGVMPSHEMIGRWFINDTMHFGTYRLKGHAVRDFWRWVSSWAVALRLPSDLGFSDAGYELPPLHRHRIIVPVDRTLDAGDRLFRSPELSATSMHQELRRTAPARAAAVARVVNASSEAWIVWCNTDYESDELMACLRGAVEVRGSHPLERKERALLGFLDGGIRVLVSKSSIFGFGLNLQHCRNAAFVGLSYSYEQAYQAVRRIYRFGQTRDVHIYEILADTETAILSTLEAKREAHEDMVAQMRGYQQRLSRAANLTLAEYAPELPMRIPEWLRSEA